MKLTFWKTGAALVAIVALSACSGAPQIPDLPFRRHRWRYDGGC